MFKSIVQGVYIIKNNYTADSYIGSSIDIDKRFINHKTKKSGVIYKEIEEYGYEYFEFSIIEEVACTSQLMIRELFWIKQLNPTYNIAKTKLPGSVLSKATRNEISIKLKQRWANKSTEEKKEFIKNNLKGKIKGRPIPSRTKEKLRLANIGKTIPEDVKLKIGKANSISMKGNTNAPMKKVDMFLNDHFVYTFDSIRLASRSVDVSREVLCLTIKKNINCCGYLFKYSTN